jgi:peptidoglycan/xylan/chitin deacetylase (PgdA/CDA1 family)
VLRRLARLLPVLAVLALPLAASASRTSEGGGPRSAARLALDRLTRLHATVYCGGRRGRLVALTFDDGPSRYTPEVLRVLRAARARATFFVVGRRVGYWPAAVRDAARVGAVGDHTWSHAALPGLRGRALREEVEWARRSAAVGSGRRVRLFRPPYGLRTAEADAFLDAHGLVEVLWDVDAGDAVRHASPTGALARVEAELRPGSIVLLHDVHPWSPWLARAVLREVRRRGLRAVTVPELLAHDPPPLVRGPDGRLRTGCR